RSLAVAWLIALAAPGDAAAEDPATIAREHFERGSMLYDLRRYREAAREYEEAYATKPLPALLFNIGQAYRFAGAAEEALASYRAYLRRVPTAENRLEVEARIRELAAVVDSQRRTQQAPPHGTEPAPRAPQS